MRQRSPLAPRVEPHSRSACATGTTRDSVTVRAAPVVPLEAGWQDGPSGPASGCQDPGEGNSRGRTVMEDRTWNRPVWKLLVAAVLQTAAVASAGGQEFQSSTSNVGYIDDAIPGNQLRLRMEAAYDINRSDRAE